MSDLEIQDLINKNKKLTEENKNYKNQIISLNDKINEQLVLIQDNKLKYDQENQQMKEKYEKEIRTLKEKIENNNEEITSIENKYKIKMNEIEKEKQLLSMSKKI